MGCTANSKQRAARGSGGEEGLASFRTWGKRQTEIAPHVCRKGSPHSSRRMSSCCLSGNPAVTFWGEHQRANLARSKRLRGCRAQMGSAPIKPDARVRGRSVSASCNPPGSESGTGGRPKGSGGRLHRAGNGNDTGAEQHSRRARRAWNSSLKMRDRCKVQPFDGAGRWQQVQRFGPTGYPNQVTLGTDCNLYSALRSSSSKRLA